MTKVFSKKNLYPVQSDSDNLTKLVLKNCLTSTKDCERTKKKLKLIFSANQVYSI